MSSRDEIRADPDYQRLELCVEETLKLAQHGTPAQIERVNALAKDMGRLRMVQWEPFDLPPGYVQLWFTSGFTCGVDSDGQVSS